MAFLTVMLLSFAVGVPFLLASTFGSHDLINFRLAQIVRENSSETDYITVCGNLDSVYLFSNRYSVSQYSYQSPVCFINGSGKSAEMLEEYFRDVETLKPKIIVLPSSFAAYERMKGVTDKSYTLLDSVGDIEIYSLIN